MFAWLESCPSCRGSVAQCISVVDLCEDDGVVLESNRPKSKYILNGFIFVNKSKRYVVRVDGFREV